MIDTIIDGCTACIVDEPHAKVLDPTDSSLALERELLTTDTKLELILAAYDDMERFASQVKQVKSLEHVVSGSEYDGKRRGGRELICINHATQADIGYG